MRYVRTFFMLAMMLTTQHVFADNVSILIDSSSDKSCSAIADACLAAGFVKAESATKGIWHDCMKPVILNQSVSGVTIEASVVKSCRIQKIKELKAELKEFQKVK